MASMAVEIAGYCDDRFRPLHDAFCTNFDEGLELGASLGVTHRGKPVVDLWGGWADLNRKKPWRKDTIVQVYSTTKIMLIMCILMLVDRRKIDLDAPVCRYWPAFAQGGKDKVTVRDFLTHQGGVPVFDPPVHWKDLRNWRRTTAHIAAQPHRFGGQKVLCYHPSTYGFVLGELIRRVDGRNPARFFRNEIARKVGADFQMGLSSRWDIRRVAELNMPVQLSPEELRAAFPDLTITEAGMLAYNENNTLLAGDVMSWKRLSLLSPSGNGFGNGRSIARLCAIFANSGRLGWRRYLSRRIVDEASREQASGEDLYIGHIRWGLGLGLDSAVWPAPSPTSFHWGGLGGSWGVMDPAARVSLGYAPNNLLSAPGHDPRLDRLNQALSTVLPVLSR
jgi:CubicO group peptidase (beta-lactamase class C family)